MTLIPENLSDLHTQEEELRQQSIDLISADASLLLHLQVVEQAMNVAEFFRRYDTSDENMKVIQVMGMRMFNSLATSLKLALSGYSQNATLVMRDILETVFLVDLFGGDRSLIPIWRHAPKKERLRQFGPAAVRKALDKRDGFIGKMRDEAYDLFCDLAAHPNMMSDVMMRPTPDGDALIGPFVTASSLTPTISELGRLAVQVGQSLVGFFPDSWKEGNDVCNSFSRASNVWFARFYPELYETIRNEMTSAYTIRP